MYFRLAFLGNYSGPIADVYSAFLYLFIYMFYLAVYLSNMILLTDFHDHALTSLWDVFGNDKDARLQYRIFDTVMAQ